MIKNIAAGLCELFEATFSHIIDATLKDHGELDLILKYSCVLFSEPSVAIVDIDLNTARSEITALGKDRP